MGNPFVDNHNSDVLNGPGEELFKQTTPCWSSDEGTGIVEVGSMHSSKSSVTVACSLSDPACSLDPSVHDETPESDRQLPPQPQSQSSSPEMQKKTGLGGKGPSKCTPITPLDTIQYVHGGYAAAAPFFAADTDWMIILRHLMPQAHANLISLLSDESTLSSNNNNSSNSIYSTNSGINNERSVDPLRIIKWAENNPIVTAYGVLEARKIKHKVNVDPQIQKPTKQRSVCRLNLNDLKQTIYNRKTPKFPNRRAQPAIEWDVFLDPTLVKHVDGAMQYLENLTKTNTWSGGLVDCDVIAAANVEVDRQISRLISRMVLAHGSTAQLAMEYAGLARNYNFSRVVRGGKVLGKKIARNKKLFCVSPTSDRNAKCEPYDITEDDQSSDSKYVRTEGIFVEEWLELFAKALSIGLQSESSGLAEVTLGSGMKNRHYKKQSSFFGDGSVVSTKIPDPMLCGLLLCLGLSEPLGETVDHDVAEMAKSARQVKSLLGEDLRIVLDLKSRRVPPRVWARLIDNLNSRGFSVDGIGSFEIDEVRKIKDLVNSPLNGLIFFHSVGDLQRACHEKMIKYGDTVYFNAGSLMWRKQGMCEPASVNCCAMNNYGQSGRTPWIDYTLSESDNELPMFQPFAYPTSTMELSYGGVEDTNSTLEDYKKRFGLNIGLYVQENAIGPDEIDSLVQLINGNPTLYTLGLAWGGLNGYTLANAVGDGYSSQRYIGSEWSFSSNVLSEKELESPPGCCTSLLID